jgi:hypothetical protein
MANKCVVCGESTGWWRTIHPECVAQKEALDRVRLVEHRREEAAAKEEHARAVQELGERLGEHLRPVESPPTLFRFNGIGTALYGHAAYDALTDSYVATQWFCIFWIPVAPVARYRVIKRGWRTYSFIAQVLDLP